MAQFVYLKHTCRMWYPVGEHYLKNFDYVRDAARAIHNTFPEGRLILVVRGHSGSILAGGIAYLLKRRGRDVMVSVSRKSDESTHGSNLEGLHKNLEGDSHIIVVDDFVQSGETVLAIISDLISRLECTYFDMLCVANHWDDEDFTEEGGERGVNSEWESNQEIASHFEYICCNKPTNEQ